MNLPNIGETITLGEKWSLHPKCDSIYLDGDKLTVLGLVGKDAIVIEKNPKRSYRLIEIPQDKLVWVDPSEAPATNPFYPLVKDKTYVYGLDITIVPEIRDALFSLGENITPTKIQDDCVCFKECAFSYNVSILKKMIILPKPSINKSGTKDSSSKVSYTEIDPHFIAAMAQRLNSNKVEFGGKYEKFNWQKPIDLAGIVDATERHLADLKCLLLGKEPIHNKEESPEAHCAAIAVNTQILHYHLKKQH